MNPVHKVPVVVGRLCNGSVPQDAGVVNDDIDPAKVVDGRLDDWVAVLNGVVVGHSLAAYKVTVFLVNYAVGNSSYNESPKISRKKKK